MGERTSGVAGFLVSGLRYGSMLVLPALLFPLGSVEPLPLHLMATLSFALTALTFVLMAPNRDSMASLAIAVALALLLALWIVIQATDLSLGYWGNSLWGTVSKVYGVTSNTISVAPADTLQGLIAVMLPFSIFLSGLMLFSSDESAVKLLRYITILGVAIALFGLIEFLAFPEMLLFEPKTLYLDSLTMVFVNRNTAATYLGMTTILTAAFAFSHLQNAGVGCLMRYLLGGKGPTKGVDAVMVFCYTLGGTIAFTALLLTRSRAGIGATMLALLILIMLLAYHGGQRTQATRDRQFATVRTAAITKFIRAGVAAMVLLAIGLAFSGRALLRAEVQGAEDDRFCIMPGLLRLTGDNLLTGTGLGTFRMVFPAYRDPSCGLTGTWERAHNFYLDGWIALGLPFVIATLIVIAALVWIFVRGMRIRQKYRWVPVAGLALLVLQIVHNAVDFSIQIPAVAAVFAAGLAACVTLSSNHPKRRQGSERSRSDQARPETAQAMSL